MSTDERFFALWNDYLEGDVDEAGISELRDLLAADDRRQQIAADLLETHRLLGLAAHQGPEHQNAFVRATLARLPVDHDAFVEGVMQSPALRTSDTADRGTSPPSKTPRPTTRSNRSPARHPSSGAGVLKRHMALRNAPLQKEYKMNRLVSAVCLSTSILTLALAVYVVRDSTSVAEHPLAGDLERVALSVDTLSERIERIETKTTATATAASVRTPARRSAAARGTSEPSEINDELAALRARMAVLEDAETIAKMAEAGEEQIRAESARALMAEIFDPDVPQEELKETLYGQWSRHGRISSFLTKSGVEEDEAVLPLFSLAQDPSVDEELRIRVLADISESKLEELRQPLLDLLRNEASSKMRQQVLRNLTAHAGNVDAQNAILAAATEDPNPEVKATAQRRLREVIQVAKEETPGSPITELTREDYARLFGRGRRRPASTATTTDTAPKPRRTGGR